MNSVTPNLVSHSCYFSFTPSEIAKEQYFYPTWCGVSRHTKSETVKRENCPCMFLAYVSKGQVQVQYEKQNYTVNEGQVFLLDASVRHEIFADVETEYYYILFAGLNTHSLVNYMKNQSGIVFSVKASQATGALLQDILRRCMENEAIQAAEFSLLIYQLIMYLLINTGSTRLDEPVAQTIEYVRKNVGEKITLDMLAEKAGLSKFHFSHVFKTETGYSPMEYVISTRLDKAKILLKTTNKSIAEIALLVGYENRGSFINLFTSKVGFSPSAFRKL